MQEKVRLKDLAEKLNISITTVSKALNGHPDISEKRRKEIIEYAASVNYVPNQVAKNFHKDRIVSACGQRFLHAMQHSGIIGISIVA